jgi:hypothetical protein
VIEATYLRKDNFIENPKLNKTNLPIKHLDFPCNNKKEDYNLTFEPFVYNNDL